MKVFVYSKQTSKKIAEVKDVKRVTEIKGNTNTLIVTVNSGEQFTFDIKDVKTTIYQN